MSTSIWVLVDVSSRGYLGLSWLSGILEPTPLYTRTSDTSQRKERQQWENMSQEWFSGGIWAEVKEKRKKIWKPRGRFQVACAETEKGGMWTVWKNVGKGGGIWGRWGDWSHICANVIIWDGGGGRRSTGLSCYVWTDVKNTGLGKKEQDGETSCMLDRVMVDG